MEIYLYDPAVINQFQFGANVFFKYFNPDWLSSC